MRASKPLSSIVMAAGLGLMSSTAAVAPASAAAVPGGTLGCPNEQWYEVSALGSARYEPIAPAVGKYNASTLASTLHYAFTTSVTKTTTANLEAGFSVNWGIAQVNAGTSYSVATAYSSGITITDDLNVPGLRYGYDQPKIERRTFQIDRYKIGSNCAQTVQLVGYVYGITAAPFLSSCVSTGQCTPKP